MFDVGLLVVNTEKRKNHESDRVRQLLAVPRYADILESRAADHEGKDLKVCTRDISMASRASKIGWRWSRKRNSEDDSHEPGAVEKKQVFIYSSIIYVQRSYPTLRNKLAISTQKLYFLTTRTLHWQTRWRQFGQPLGRLLKLLPHIEANFHCRPCIYAFNPGLINTICE